MLSVRAPLFFPVFASSLASRAEFRDGRGTIHALRRGSYMGENTGIIDRTDDDAIYVRQVVSRNGNREEAIARLARRRQ